MTSTLSSLEISPKERARKRAEYEVKFKIKSAFVAKDIPRLHDLLKENYWALNQSFDENNQTLLMLAAKMPNDAGYPLAQYLLNLGADWTQRMSPPTELTAQDLARTSGSQKILTLLQMHAHQASFISDHQRGIKLKFRVLLDDLQINTATGGEREHKGEESADFCLEPLLKKIEDILSAGLSNSALGLFSWVENSATSLFLEGLYSLFWAAGELQRENTDTPEEQEKKLKTELVIFFQVYAEEIAGTPFDYPFNSLGNLISLELVKALFPSENPWSILLQKSLEASPDRTEPWLDAVMLEPSPGGPSSSFYRVYDPRLTTQKDKTKVHVVEQILDQITSVNIAEGNLERIWRGTDPKGGNGIHTEPLTSYDFDILRQFSPSLDELISFTKDLDQKRIRKLKSLETPNFYTAFSSLALGLELGNAANGGTEFNAGSAANIALVEFTEKFWKKIPEKIKKEIMAIRGLEARTLGITINRLLNPERALLPTGAERGAVQYCIQIIGRNLSSDLALESVRSELYKLDQEFRGPIVSERIPTPSDPWAYVALLIAKAKKEIQHQESEALYSALRSRITLKHSLDLLCNESTPSSFPLFSDPTLQENVFKKAIKEDDISKIRFYGRAFPSLLKRAIVFVSEKTPERSLLMTALIAAVKRNPPSIKMIQTLLTLGADINGLDDDKDSALAWAIYKKHFDIALFLLSQNPKPSTQQINAYGDSLLTTAAKANAPREIFDALFAEGVSQDLLNHRNKKELSALAIAIKNKNFALAHLLYAKGGNPEDLDSNLAFYYLRERLKTTKSREHLPKPLIDNLLALASKIQKYVMSKDMCDSLLKLAVTNNRLDLFLTVLDQNATKYDRPDIYPRPAGFNQWLCQRFTQADANTPEQVRTTLEILKKLELDKAKILEIFQKEIREGALGDGAIQARSALNSIVHKHPEDKTSLAARVFWKERIFTSKNIRKGTLLLAHNLIAPAAPAAAPHVLSLVVSTGPRTKTARRDLELSNAHSRGGGPTKI